jgi:hypothetical protein
MSRRNQPVPDQLGFEALLADAAQANDTRQIARACAHLPGTFDEALPFYRGLIDRHHAAMLAGDAPSAMHLREEADLLATKLNNFEPGILAGEDAPGCVLDRATRAPAGHVPLWGQSGSFEIVSGSMRVRIAMDGIFGIAANVYHWLGFAAHAIDFERPFLSETGFRSFVAIGGALEPDFTPDTFATEVIAAHVKRELKGRLLSIKADHRRRDASRDLQGENSIEAAGL